MLDPWSGSGTSMFGVSRRGALGTGIDLSPVQIDIATARCADHATVVAVQALIENFLDVSAIQLINEWDRPLHAIVKFEEGLGRRLQAGRQNNEARALLRVCIYFTLRKCALSSKSTNPTWFKSMNNLTSHSEEFLSAFRGCFNRIEAIQLVRSREIKVRPCLFNADFASWNAQNSTYDAILTSPPYLTRIDYVQATYPELIYRSNFEQIDMQKLRRQMLGTPLTSGTSIVVPENIGVEASRLLTRIREHKSKASSTYYYRFFAQYLVKLSVLVARMSNLLKEGGRAAIVVQDSYYKEILVNLPAIVIDMAIRNKLEPEDVQNFVQKSSMNNVNRRSISAQNRLNPTESAIFFRKTK